MKRIKAGLSSRTLAGFLWVVVILAGIAGLYSGAQLFSGLDPFRVELIEVTGNKLTTKKAVEEATGIVKGQKHFSVDVQQVRDQVMELPWIRSAEVVKRISGTVSVDVTEWEPAYLVRLNRLHYMTTEAHVVSAPLEAGLDYPIITGLGWAELEAPGKVRDAVGELVALLDQGYFGGPLSEINVVPPLKSSHEVKGQ